MDILTFFQVALTQGSGSNGSHRHCQLPKVQSSEGTHGRPLPGPVAATALISHSCSECGRAGSSWALGTHLVA